MFQQKKPSGLGSLHHEYHALHHNSPDSHRDRIGVIPNLEFLMALTSSPRHGHGNHPQSGLRAMPVHSKEGNHRMNTHSSSILPSASSASEEQFLNSGTEGSPRAKRSAGMLSGPAMLGGVLVIDDEPDVRRVIRLTLEKAGYDVVEAEDGEQAIQVINEGEHPMVLDVILTDIRMPRINGLEAITYFQREYPSVPLIVLTGFPDLAMAIRLLNCGITDYLVKPVEREKLMSAVANALAQRRIHWF
jgi:two-component system chemotaxis response regulator CheY